MKIVKNRNEEENLFLTLYESHRKELINWGKKNTSLHEPDLEDAFQDAVIVVYKKLNLIESEKSLVSFLWTAFKFKLQHKFRDRIRFRLEEDINDVFPEGWSDHQYEKMNNDHLSFHLKAALEKLKDPCKTLLRLLIYKGYSPEAVADSMGYKNVSVVYTKTNVCLKRLKELTANKL